MDDAASLLRVDFKDRPIGTILRPELSRFGVAFRAVHVLATTADGSVWLSRLGAHRERFAGRWGSSVATLARAEEDYEATLWRGLRSELQIEPASIRPGHITWVAKTHMLERRARKFVGVFVCAMEELPSSVAGGCGDDALESWTPSEIAYVLRGHPQRFTPTFLAVWRTLRRAAREEWVDPHGILAPVLR